MVNIGWVISLYYVNPFNVVKDETRVVGQEKATLSSIITGLLFSLFLRKKVVIVEGKVCSRW